MISRCTFYVMAVIVVMSHAQISTQEPYIKEPFFDDFDSDKVNSQTWRVATWAEHGGQTSAERCYVKDGCLNLIFINDAKKGFLSSAIETKSKFFYGKWEARLKPSNVAGILNSMYTIDWDNTTTTAASDGSKEEIDIEFLTFSFKPDYGEVHFAVHEEGLKSFETNPDVKLDFNPSNDFHVWGINITSEYIEWSVDGNLLKKYEYKG
ncbi:MAG: glycoside hydrolase family 16 protein, partial [Fibrobacter sp.]|nr:glycoside hydrolase family 16 protein [Fibrobacter sp.]